MKRRTWNRVASDVVQPIWDTLNELSDAELRTLIRAEQKATTSNCYWLTYRLAPALASLARDCLGERKRARKLARRGK